MELQPADIKSPIRCSMEKPAGFTLIEILVTVVISGILFGGGIAAYRGIGARQNLKQAGIEFQSNLRLIQEKTLSSQKPDGCDVLLGYKVSYIGVNTYSMQPICQNGAVIITNVDLLEGVNFTADFGEISFLVLQAGVEDKTIILTNSDGLQFQVTIESKGVITGGML